MVFRQIQNKNSKFTKKYIRKFEKVTSHLQPRSVQYSKSFGRNDSDEKQRQCCGGSLFFVVAVVVVVTVVVVRLLLVLMLLLLFVSRARSDGRHGQRLALGRNVVGIVVAALLPSQFRSTRRSLSSSALLAIAVAFDFDNVFVEGGPRARVVLRHRRRRRRYRRRGRGDGRKR